MPVHCSPRRSRSPTITERHRQSRIHAENALSGRNNTGRVRSGRPSAGGFHCTSRPARLAALVPMPRVNLTRYHGVLARGGHPPNHRWRRLVTPARRGKGLSPLANVEVRSSADCHAAMTWAQRLKRVFNIDIEVCGRCGGAVRIIACIEDQEIIVRILAHLHKREQATPALPLLTPPSRAPPETFALFAGSETTTPNQQGSH